MYVTAAAKIVINSTSEAVWEYASDPVNWTASNPKEHFGLEYESAWMFRFVLKGPQAVYNHTYKELLFIKSRLERGHSNPEKVEAVVPVTENF